MDSETVQSMLVQSDAETEEDQKRKKLARIAKDQKALQQQFIKAAQLEDNHQREWTMNKLMALQAKLNRGEVIDLVNFEQGEKKEENSESKE